jgi:hypothetical protein
VAFEKRVTAVIANSLEPVLVPSFLVILGLKEAYGEDLESKADLSDPSV